MPRRSKHRTSLGELAPRAIFYFALFAAGLSCQIAHTQGSLSGLTATILELRDLQTTQAAHSERITDTIMSLTGKERRPSRPTVARLADAVTKALIGRNLSDRQASEFAAAIVDVASNAHVDDRRARESIKHAKETLISFGVSAVLAQEVAVRLAAFRQHIGAPEDIPLELPR